MSIIQKLLVGFFERSCKSYITTIVGLLVVLLYAVNTFSAFIPAQYHADVQLAYTLLAAVALTLAHDFNIKLPSFTEKLPDTTDVLKIGSIVILVFMFAVAAVSVSEAQTLSSPVAGDFVGVGASLNPGATPIGAGSAFYCHALSDTDCVLGTIDALPSTKPNFNLRTNIGSGEAHRFLVLVNGRLEVWGTVGAGLTYTTENLGWNFESGGLVGYQIKPNSPWRVFVAARLEKASVGGANYRPAITGGLIRKF